MIDPPLLDFNPIRGAATIRLGTLTTLRWVAAAGQSAALAAGWALHGARPELALCLPLIALLPAANLLSRALGPPGTRLSGRVAAGSLLFDLVQLTALLAATGGLANPFALLLLAPVTVAASVLERGPTAALALAALIGATLLRLAPPLPLETGALLAPPPLFLNGFWAALAIAILFMSAYASRIGRDSARMTQALAAARMALAREQRLAALGALAAAAAHELGTPLATIKLVAAELARDLKDRPEAVEDLALLRAQAERCAGILRDLAEGGKRDAGIPAAPAFALVTEAAGPRFAPGKTLELRLNGAETVADDPSQPFLRRSPELIHGLRNLLQNAASFARRRIRVEVEAGAGALAIRVSDDGPGFPRALIDRLGDPFVTTRPAGAGREDGYEGMGLGLFISAALLGRIGARLRFENDAEGGAEEGAGAGTDALGGARIVVLWPRGEALADAAEARAAPAPEAP